MRARLTRPAENKVRASAAMEPRQKSPAGHNQEWAPIQRQENRTGLPDGLKAGIESVSGYVLDDVRVHYNSAKPAKLNAHAYTQGTNIHVAPGQNRHLPHEAWHVVQQKQGRVAPTGRTGGVAINADRGLEQEADRMGSAAARAEPVFCAAPRRPARFVPPVVQGYFKSDRLEAGAGSAPLRSHAPLASPTGSLNPSEPALDYAKQTTDPAGAPFLVADDGSMAIHDTVNEAKEFFALEAVVENSNAGLAGVQSPLRLTTGGGSVTVGEQTLPRVRPVADNKGGAEALWTDICISLANIIMGNAGSQREEIALRDAESGRDRSGVVNVGGQGASEIGRLANHLAPPAGALEIARDDEDVDRPEEDTAARAWAAMRDPSHDHEFAGRRYGRKLGAGTLNAQSHAIGINAHVQPDVGEGFATFTVSPGPENPFDFSDPEHKEGIDRPDVWGYHHAAVVARSLAGGDWITLENYRRRDTAHEAVHTLLSDKHEDIREKILEFKAPAKEGDPEPAAEVVKEKTAEYIESAYSSEFFAAYEPLMNQAASLWFFRMYGSKKGQTFHDIQKASGGFLNPLTVRVRRHVPSAIERLLNSLVSTGDNLAGAVSAAQVSWPAARTALDPLEVQIKASYATMRGILTDLPADAANADVVRATAAINTAFAALLKDHLIPRLAEALRATMHGAPTVAPTTPAALRTMAQTAEPAGYFTGAANYLRNRGWLAQNVPDERQRSLKALRGVVDRLPRVGLDV
ncbi:MAG TPA: DUF4157 domain-containing protein [Rhizomicrobium sp.]